MSRKNTLLARTGLVCALLAQDSVAALKLADVFSDHMVLQREQAVPVWGTADAGSAILVEFAGQKKTAAAGGDGKWLVKLDPLAACAEPHVLRVISTSNPQPVTINDVLVGDVWLCSGQSNMGLSVRESANPEQEIAAAQYPAIRLFTVAPHPAPAPTNGLKGAWAPCSPQTVAGFSAAAYFFGRELHRELKIPIGLLHSSVGGTPAEAWTRLAALETVPELGEAARKEIAQWKAQPEDTAKFPALRAEWEKKYGVERPENTGLAKGWADPAHDTNDWQRVPLGRSWGQLGYKTGGVFWVRKDVVLPDSAAGKPFLLSLLWLSEQYETVWFNGVEISRGVDAPPEFYMAQRHYQVPGPLVRAGRNVIAVRVVSASEKNGFWTWGRTLNLPGVAPLSVGDEWLLKQESAFPALPPDALAARPKPNTLAARCVSSALYNGMIAPLVPFAIKGAIWYQGESNWARPGAYRELLSLMIRDWRTQWGQGDFPFIIQQLVNNDLPSDDANRKASWPYLREAQMQVADTVPNCGVAVGIELGDAFTIHPKNKQEVGRRLALVAFEKTYGRKIESSPPRYLSMKAEGSALRVTFTHAAGLVAKGGPLRRFAIAGADKKFVWADARVEGETVVVSSPQVPQPVAARYAWTDNPEGCNLYNAADLPAAPFRTNTDDKP